MFSALKKRLTRQDDSKTSPFPSGVAAIGQAMQAKFAKGVQYNMKIIIRGERNTGKSCLLARLQGKPFHEAYIPTQEIQAASINWNYRGGDDIVKVEVWDIVDKGQKKKAKQDMLKVSNDSPQDNEDGVALDAAFIDVYKGTHGVIMLMDITKPWTWNYIERELPRVPNHIPILVLIFAIIIIIDKRNRNFFLMVACNCHVGHIQKLFLVIEESNKLKANFRDMGEHRLVDSETMTAVVENLDRSVGSAEVNFVESSLKTGFGLRYLYQFLNMPFLILQRETLLRQLEANALEIEEFREMLLRDEEKEDQNYDKFMQSLASRKVKTSGADNPSSETDDTASEASPSVSSNRRDLSSTSTHGVTTSPLPPANVRQSAVSSEKKVANGRNYTARVENHEEKGFQDNDASSPVAANDIHEFSPDSDLDPNFLDEKEKKRRWWNKKETKREPEPITSNVISDEESDEEGGNPLVMEYQDFDSDDESPIPAGSTASKIQQDTNEYEIDANDDIIDDDSEEEGKLDDSDSESGNPAVEPPADIESLDEEIVTPKPNEPKQLLATEPINDIIQNHDDAKMTKIDNIEEKQKEADNLEEVSSDDETEAGVQYEVTPDFDIDDEPALNDWLGGGDDKEKGKAKVKTQDSIKEAVLSVQSEEESGDESSKAASETKNADKVQPSFMISPDELDLFVSEQMRKTSISQESEEGEKKKPRKNKEKKQGEGEKKKKKKPSKDRENATDQEQEQKKKKSKSKEGKKRKTTKRTTESDDYELL